VTRPHRGLVITGSALLAAGGFLSVVAAAWSPHDLGYAPIPLAGPFIAGVVVAKEPCGGWICLNGLAELSLFSVGVLEVVGATALTAGLATKEQVLRSDVALPVVPVPVVMRNGSGLALAGTF
jgi:hypothetical protein